MSLEIYADTINEGLVIAIAIPNEEDISKPHVLCLHNIEVEVLDNIFADEKERINEFINQVIVKTKLWLMAYPEAMLYYGRCYSDIYTKDYILTYRDSLQELSNKMTSLIGLLDEFATDIANTDLIDICGISTWRPVNEDVKHIDQIRLQHILEDRLSTLDSSVIYLDKLIEDIDVIEDMIEG